jgi:HEAT repeat protein
MADSPFKLLIDTTSLWLPALTWLVARLSATRPGRKIEEGLKVRLKWLKDPEVEKAFQSAFEKGIHRYEQQRGQLPVAQAVAQVLKDVAEHDLTDLDRATVLDQIFEVKPDIEALGSLARNHFGILTAEAAPVEAVTTELELLISKYLRPAFRKQRVFTERVGFAEMISLLQDIRVELAAPAVDLEALRRDYCAKMTQKYEYLTMQGISPKVQNRTIGIRMEDVFIPLKSRQYLDGVLGSITSAAAKLLSATEVSIWTVTAGGSKTRQEALRVEEGKDSKVLQFHWSARGELGGGEEARAGKLGDATISDLLGQRRAVVCGDPGSGKSTLTSYIAWALASGKSQLIGTELTGTLPIRIRAIELGDAIQAGRCDTLEDYLFGDSGRFASLVKFALVAGQALVMIDGLDEISKPALRGQVKESVDDFVADPAFANNQILVTTRIVGYERSGLTGSFPHFTLVELDDEQITTFVENWYRVIHQEMPATIDVETEKKQLLNAILKKENIHRLARNPLLLTIIALIKWQGRDLPDQRVLLYDAATQTLIRTWPLTLRRVELDELLIREWLAPVALYILAHSTNGLMDEYTLMEQMVASMKQLKPVAELEARQASNQLLENISIHSGILLPKGTDEDGRTLYGFMHQTFAEYLAAYYLAGRWEDKELDLCQYAHDPYWREVLLLIAGILGVQRRQKAGQLIGAICDLQSSPYEKFIRRDLRLAGRILCDGVPASPGDRIESVLRNLLKLWLDVQIPRLREDALNVLGGLKGTEYAPTLIRLAREAGMNSKRLVELAPQLGAEHLKDDLLSLLVSQDGEVRTLAAGLLLDIGDAKAHKTVLGWLEAEDVDMRLAAARLLDRKEPKVHATLVSLLSHHSPRVSLESAWQLMLDLDPAAIATLIEMAGLEDLDTGREAASALLEMGADEALKQVLDSGNAAARLLIAQNRSRIDAQHGAATLEDLLQTQVPTIRLAAARQLMRENPAKAAPVLEEMMNTGDPDVRLEAATTMAENGNANALDVLHELTKGEQMQVGLKAVEILLAHSDPRGKQAAVGWLTAADPWLRFGAASLMVEEGDGPAIQTLRDLQNASDPRLRWEATYLLKRRGEDVSVEFLSDLLMAVDAELVQAVSSSLYQRDFKRCVETLTAILDAPQAARRLAAADFLSRQKDPDAFAALKSRLIALLRDTEEVPQEAGGPRLVKGADCVADVAYRFLERYLTPDGQVRLPSE